MNEKNARILIIDVSGEYVNQIQAVINDLQYSNKGIVDLDEAMQWQAKHKYELILLIHHNVRSNALKIVPMLQQIDGFDNLIVVLPAQNESLVKSVLSLNILACYVCDNLFFDILSFILIDKFKSIAIHKQLAKINHTVSELDVYYSQLVDSVNEGIIVYDLDYNFKVWNPYMEKLTGIKAGEVLGKNPLVYFPFLENEGVIAAIQKAINTGTSSEVEFYFKVPKTGKEGWVTDCTGPLFNSKREIIGVITTVRDTTTRKVSEQKLEKSEEKNRILLNTMMEGVSLNEFVFNDKGEAIDFRILEVNDAFKKIAKHENTEVAGLLATETYNISQSVIQQFWKENKPFKSELHIAENNSWVMISASQPVQNRFVVTFFDITDRKKLEQNLRSNELKFKTLVNYTYDWEYWIGVNNQMIYVSPSCKNITGYSQEDFYANPKLVWELVHGDDRELYIEKSKNKLLVTGVNMMDFPVDEFDFRILTKNGEVKFLHHISRPIYGEQNEYLGRRVSNRDITVQKKMELKLRESEYFFKQSQIAGSIGSYKTDFNGNQWISSEVLDQIFGIDNNYDKSIQGWLDIVHPDDQIMMSDYLTEEVIGKRNKFDKEYRIIRKSDGVTRWVHGYGESEFNSDGAIISLIGTIQDVTERVEADMQLSLLSKAIDQTPVSIVVTDKKGNIEYVNPKFTSITGYSFSEAFGQNPRILNSGNQPKEFFKIMWETILSGKDWYGEFQNKTKNGELYWESVVISPVFNGQGIIEHFIAVKEDITQLKRLNEKLSHSLEKAEENDRLKSAFLQNMSHEIRTPMNSIIGFSKLLRKTDLNESKINRYTSAIVISANDLLSKINDIITISSLETRQESVHLQSVAVNDILEELYLKQLQLNQNTDVLFNIKKGLEDGNDEIMVDKDKFEQILTHLLNNAFKFTREGLIELGYSIDCRRSENDNCIVFYVKDTGIGIQREWQTKIFDRFVQCDSTTSRKFEGNGIGLSISKGFVELMGGKIWVESEFGKGSCFYFTLPLKRIEHEVRVDNRLISTSKVPKLLVVEDEYFNLLLIQEILIDFNVEIIHAKSGEEAIEICKSTPDLDLILMDIKLPKMNGYLATKIIKGLNNQIPIVAQSAYALDSETHKFKDEFDDYITKPINVDVFMKTITKYLGTNIATVVKS